MSSEDSHILKNLYDKVIVNEISQQYVDHVLQHVDTSHLPFDNIFGTKLRLILPIGPISVYRSILDRLTSIPNYSRFDPETKEVVRKIKLDPKFGKGEEKEQRVNLGRAIQSLKISDDEKKKYLNWFAKFGSEIPELESKVSEYVVVLSRSPIDVLRMGEIGNTGHCHQQGNSYFKCAIQEAKTGGPIAFVVPFKEVSQLSSDEELQHEEIFMDDARNVNGIKALSRLRVRCYTDKESQTRIAVPEVRVYGRTVAGFYDTVRDFVRIKQNINVEEVAKDFNAGLVERNGGSYIDSHDDDLFNKLFEVESFTYGRVEHEENDEDANDPENLVEAMENELTEIKDRYFEQFDHSRIWFDVSEDDNEPYYDASGSLTIVLDGVEINDEFIDIGTDGYEKTIDQIESYDPDSEYQWKKRIPHMFKNNAAELLRCKKFLKYLDDNCPRPFSTDDIYGISSDVANEIILHFKFNGGESMSMDVRDFRSLCETITEYDAKYDTIKRYITKALKMYGYLEGTEENGDLTELNDDEVYGKLKNFDRDDAGIAHSHILIAHINSEYIDTLNDNNKQVVFMTCAKFAKFLGNFLKAYYKPEKPAGSEQMSFKNFFEAAEFHSPDLDEYGIDKIELQFYKQSSYGAKNTLDAELFIYYDFLDKKTADLLTFLDAQHKDITNGLRLCAAKTLNIRGDYVDNLVKVYGHFVYGA